MAGDFARLYRSFWGDPDVRSLDRDAQRLYLLLLSQPNRTHCGSLDYIPSRLACLAADETIETLQAALGTLERERFIVVDHVMSEILIRSYVRWDGVLSQPNVTKAMLNARAALLSDELRAALDCELARAYREDSKAKGWAAFKEANPELFNQVRGNPSGNPSGKG